MVGLPLKSWNLELFSIIGNLYRGYLTFDFERSSLQKG